MLDNHNSSVVHLSYQGEGINEVPSPPYKISDIFFLEGLIMVTRVNAGRIAEWRAAHPTERLTAQVLLNILGLTTLPRADLSGANLSGAYLYGAYLSGANLSGANLSGADLYGADLYGADLSEAYLYGIDLSGAYLSGANLSGAYLSGANLSGAYLYWANLAGANLAGANLAGVVHAEVMPINAGASGMGALYPQADGWHVSIGCWRHHTLDELADLLADRITWPEAEGEERERRRPLLQAVYTTCLAFVDQMPSDLIAQHAAARAEVTS